MSTVSSRNSNGQFMETESFGNFYNQWIREQNGNLTELISAAASSDESKSSSVVNRVIGHYEKYYKEKELYARRDAAAMLTPQWESSLENAFLWIGGWRPSMAFHLLYSKSGIQLLQRSDLIEAGLSLSAADLAGIQLLQGSDLIEARLNSADGDLAGISADQMAAMDELQRRTVREERRLSERMAEKQEGVAAADLVKESSEERFGAAVRGKELGLGEILEMADELRLRTLKGVVEILTDSQALHFLIAAAELHLRLHDWGFKKDNAAADRH